MVVVVVVHTTQLVLVLLVAQAVVVEIRIQREGPLTKQTHTQVLPVLVMLGDLVQVHGQQVVVVVQVVQVEVQAALPAMAGLVLVNHMIFQALQ